MKKIWLILMIIFCMTCLTGCGDSESEVVPEISEYLVIQAEQEEIVYPAEKSDKWQLLSMQYYHEELVQFWAVKTTNEELQACLDIYLYREGGTAELLMSNVATKYDCRWFIDEEGCFYLLSVGEIIKLNKEGTVIYRKLINGGNVTDICQLTDGKIMLIVRMEDESAKLCQMDAAEGTITIKGNVVLEEGFHQYITANANGLLLMDGKGVWSVNLEDGSKTAILDFVEQVYALDEAAEDFRVLEDGSVEILQRTGNLECLRLVDINESKIVITVRENTFQYYMPDYVAQFNASSDKYFVVLEERDADTALADFRERTNVEIGTGGGPDIIMQDALMDAESLIEKGAFENLSPYMERSGLNEEDYFPAAFDYWRDGDKIYSVNMEARSKGLWISEELLDGNEKPNIETLVNLLLAYPEKAMFKTAWESNQVLDYFLIGSEDLWGMIDWEMNTCDFNGKLFAKMLEAAKQYGFDPKKDYPALSEFFLDNFYSFQTKEQLESEGKRLVGYIFEDGCYPSINQTGVMVINSNSDEAHKEGAWEFIKFLLSEELQSTIHHSTYPVSKKAFEKIAAREVEEGAIVHSVDANGRKTTTIKAGNSVWMELKGDEAAFKALYDLTEEKVDEIREMLESCKNLPTGTAYIRAIICEEAATYFDGTKSIEEVVPVIENRVQLYLNEK